MKLELSYEDDRCKCFDVYNDSGVMIAYYYEDISSGNSTFEVYFDLEEDEGISCATSETLVYTQEELNTLLLQLEQKVLK